MSLILNTATILFETIILFMFYNNFMDWKRENKIFIFAAVSIEFILSMLNGVFIKPPFMTAIFTIIICFIVSLFFTASFSKKIFCLFSFVILAVVSELLTSSVMIRLNIGTTETLMMPDSTVRIAGTIVSKIVFMLLLRLIMLFDLKNKKSVYHSYWLWLMSVPMMNITMLMSVCYFFDGINNKTSVPFTIITTCCMYINIIVFYLFEKILDVAELTNRNNALGNQITFQAEQSDAYKDEIQKLTAVRHDITTHFQLLYEMLKHGCNAEAEQYILDLEMINEETAEWVNTGNMALDAVFNAKISYAKDMNIDVTVDITVPNDLKIGAVDTAVLFGNLMDNAIESCEKITGSDKKIIIYISYRKNHIICRMENSVNKKLYEDKPLLMSLKPEGLHGIGIHNIDSVVEKYNGIIKRSLDGDMFINELSLWNV